MHESTSAETLIVIGASSAIAHAFINQAIVAQGQDVPIRIISISRQPALALPQHSANITQQHFYCDYQQASIIECVNNISLVAARVSRIVMCNGILRG
jgi:hypothetical protein